MDEVLLVKATESAFSRHAPLKAPRRSGALSIASRSSESGSEPTEAAFYFGLGYHVVVASRAASGLSRLVPSMAMELICSESIQVASCCAPLCSLLRLQAVIDSTFEFDGGS